MPTLHRLATLRDDVIYFIALYQSWVYRVDHRRVNEFGQGGDGNGEDEGGFAAAEAKKVEAAAEEKVDEKEPVKASGAQTTSNKAASKRR